MTQRMVQQSTPAWHGTQAGYQPSRHQPREHWQEFTMGLVGGAVGVLAMDLFRQHISPLLMPEDNGQGANGNTRQVKGGRDRQQSELSLGGQNHRPDQLRSRLRRSWHTSGSTPAAITILSAPARWATTKNRS